MRPQLTSLWSLFLAGALVVHFVQPAMGLPSAGCPRCAICWKIIYVASQNGISRCIIRGVESMPGIASYEVIGAYCVCFGSR